MLGLCLGGLAGLGVPIGRSWLSGKEVPPHEGLSLSEFMQAIRET